MFSEIIKLISYVELRIFFCYINYMDYSSPINFYYQDKMSIVVARKLSFMGTVKKIMRFCRWLSWVDGWSNGGSFGDIISQFWRDVFCCNFSCLFFFLVFWYLKPRTKIVQYVKVMKYIRSLIYRKILNHEVFWKVETFDWIIFQP